MRHKYRKILLLGIILAVLPVFVFAEDLSVTCQEISESTEDVCNGLDTAQCRALLEKCANYYDQQSNEIAQDLSKTQAQKSTLQNEIYYLKRKITGLEYQINQGNVMVKDLGLQISDTQISIDKTNAKIKESQNQVAQILRLIYQEDQKPSFQILFEGNLADFFSNVAYLESLNSKVSTLLESTKNLEHYLENQLGKMASEKDQVQRIVKVQNLQKQENEKAKQEQDYYLKLTEVQYQKQLQEKQATDAKAAAIKARIFDLLGVSKAPTFGEALEIAKYVQSVTGVRPAFLLAILTQESNLGKNVGQCYVTDFVSGDGTNLQGTPKPRVMNPKNISGFIQLTGGLGMDPKKTPVSCWIPLYTRIGVPYGWGGAMGPAQFIASTWTGYTSKVTQVTGRLGNPWNINDAFLASGLYLRDLGAASEAKYSEYNAAAKYYCGGNYGRYECRSYANSVASYASQYEADIKAIGG